MVVHQVKTKQFEDRHLCEVPLFVGKRYDFQELKYNRNSRKDHYLNCRLVSEDTNEAFEFL